jgi:hypothetical protein
MAIRAATAAPSPHLSSCFLRSSLAFFRASTLSLCRCIFSKLLVRLSSVIWYSRSSTSRQCSMVQGMPLVRTATVRRMDCGGGQGGGGQCVYGQDS